MSNIITGDTTIPRRKGFFSSAKASKAADLAAKTGEGEVSALDTNKDKNGPSGSLRRRASVGGSSGRSSSDDQRSGGGGGLSGGSGGSFYFPDLWIWTRPDYRRPSWQKMSFPEAIFR
jgi:hypothetical protein